MCNKAVIAELKAEVMVAGTEVLAAGMLKGGGSWVHREGRARVKQKERKKG